MRYVFKTIWNRRRELVWISFEQCVVFILLMLCFASVFKALWQYLQPGLPDTSDTVVIAFSPRQHDKATMTKSPRVASAISENMSRKEYVRSYTRSLFLAPYLREDELYFADSVSFAGSRYKTYIKGADVAGSEVFRFEIEEGRWLSESGLSADGNPECVITRKLADDMGLDAPVGKSIVYNNMPITIAGVISGIRHAVFEPPVPALILSNNLLNPSGMVEYCFRLEKGSYDRFSADFAGEFRKLADDDIVPTLFDAEDTRRLNMYPVMMKLYAISIPTVFLLIFALLGTFGVVQLNTRRRLEEFAVRFAIGSTRSRLMRDVLSESLVVTLISAVPGLLLALFIYDSSVWNVCGVGAALLSIVIFSLASTAVPAYKVSRLSISKALRYE